MERVQFLQQAKAKVAKYCSVRERAPKQVKEKLDKWGLSTSEIDEIIEILKSDRYLDEYRFSRAFCHDKFEFNSWGRVKIKVELYKYDLDQDAVQMGLTSINQRRYFDRAMALAENKWRQLPDSDEFLKRQKTVQYLVRKGFESDLSWKATENLS